MNPFFYFIPNRNTLTPADAAAIGLAYAFEKSIDCAQVSNGPGGQHGIICAQVDSYGDGQLGYHPDRQIWIQIPGSGGISAQPQVHVGHYKGHLPTADELLRQKPLGGLILELDSGDRWLCPQARSYSEKMEGDELAIYWHCQLPQRLSLGADGHWVRGGVTGRYAALWELTEAWQRMKFPDAPENDRRRFDDEGQIDAAVLCLQANYRIGRIEASVLGLLNDELVGQILDCNIDWATFVSLIQKKTALAAAKMASSSPSIPPATPNSSAGPAGETPITDQPAPT